MMNDIKKELKSIAKGILETPGYIESKGSMDIIENLYKKLVIYNFLDKKNKKNDQDVNELNGIEKNTKAEMTSEKIPEFIKKTPVKEKVTKSKKTINDLFSKDLNIDLNDRLAFIKNLFDSNEDDYQRVISQLKATQASYVIERGTCGRVARMRAAQRMNHREGPVASRCATAIRDWT